MKKIYFLMMELVLGALTGYAKDAQQGCKIYFDATGWNAQVVQFCIGHDTWTATYEMSKIDNTNLYYYEVAEKWGGYNYFAVIGAGEKWGDGNWSVDNLKNAPNYTAPQLDYDLNAESYSISQTGNNTINTAWLENGYESLNYAQKVEAGEGGSVVAASFALNSNNTTEATEGTEINAALTATVTCVATPAEGYLFDGWYEGEDKVSADATYSYVVTGEKSLTAKFIAEPVITYPEKVYMVGYNGDYVPANPLEITGENGIYTAEAVEFTNTEFKLSTTKGTWDEFNAECLYVGEVTIGTLAAITQKDAYSKIEAGTYNITIDLVNNTFLAVVYNDPTTAIESIEAENAPVEYYNLQGVKVANPENGLFIKKQGNKAVKVIL